MFIRGSLFLFLLFLLLLFTMKNLKSLISDQAGQMTVEWTLLVAAFGLPMIYTFREMLDALASYYGFITCIITLPFP